MTDEEFQRIKEAEKERLRTQKRLRATLESLKQRNEVQSVVRRMSQGAKRLLKQTEAFTDTVASQAARQAARLEVATSEDPGDDLSTEEAEETLRDERAEAIVRRLKEEERRRPAPATTESASSDVSENRTEDGPDKTIGRMGDLRSDDSA